MRMNAWFGRVISLLLLVMIALAAPAAFAQEPAQKPQGPKPKVFLLPTQGVQDSVSSIVPERIGDLLREQLRKDAQIALMPDFAEIQRRLGGAGHSSAAIAEAEKLYNSGIGLLTAGEDKKAAESFQRAVDLMEQNLGDLANFDILADAIANLALAYFNAEFDLDARKRMQQYAHLRPDVTLDPEKFPKELIKIYEAEAKKVKSAGPGRLEITSEPEGALVVIDGVEKGQTPVTVDDVGFGHHYLTVRGGASVWAEKIRVRGRKKKQEFKADLGKDAVAAADAQAGGEQALPSFYTDLLATIATGSFGENLRPYLRELASQTGAEYVAWVAMYKDKSTYVAAPFIYRASDEAMVHAEDVTFNIELSNLLAGVSTLGQTIVEAVLQMPEDRAFTSVELVEPAEEKETKTVVAERGDEKEQEPAGPYEGSQLQPPPQVPPSQTGNTWTYIGVAAGSVVLVGLVAGGIYMLSDDSNPSASSGFNAEVSW